MTSPLWTGVVVAAGALAVGLGWHLSGRDRWVPALRRRFLYGVPWGTLVVVGFVLSVYLFVQGGLWHWNDPVVLPFRAWSYLYPTGMLTAGFAHGSPGHLIGNLLGTMVLGPIAEYAWGHYPASSDNGGPATDAAAGDNAPRVDSARGKLRSWLGVPWFRAVVAFPAAVLTVGLLTALFSIGPIIGFSGVVFALGGLAVVHYPIRSLAALLAMSAVGTVYYTLRQPVVRAGISGSPPSPPWWAEVAVQGHALGVLIGVCVGLALLWARGERPEAGRVMFATFVYATTRNLWAIYWFEGEGTYVLYRGLGVVLVVALALVVTLGAVARDRPLSEAIAELPGNPTARQLAAGWIGCLLLGVLLTVGLVALAGGPVATVLLVAAALALIAAVPATPALLPLEIEGEVSGRMVAVAALVATTAIVAGPAIYPNLGTVDDDPVPGERAIEVQGYDVTYAEGVQNGMIPAIDLPVAGEETNLTTSGVIVVNQDRNLWANVLSKQYLESEGRGTVTLGGPGWRETVVADRTGWAVLGNDTVYAVDVYGNGQSIRAYSSSPSRASPVIQNHSLTIVPARDRFRIRVTRNNTTVGEAPIPRVGNATALGPLAVRTARVDGRVSVFAETAGTNVTIAKRETYRQR